MPVLKEASQILCQPVMLSEDLPPWDAPLFPLSPLNTMVMRSMRKAFDKVPSLSLLFIYLLLLLTFLLY